MELYNGVYCIGENAFNFSKEYLKARELEKRILSDEQVLKLPNYKGENRLVNEWKLRKCSMARFHHYINKNYNRATILDLGCGNGWFTNSLANLSNVYNVIGVDVNLHELEQAARVFKKPNLSFINGNVFEIKQFVGAFDIIVINAAIQYFPDVQKLLTVLELYLKSNGEIHIIDSPFYTTNFEVRKAKQRTQEYYSKLGVPGMANHYHHQHVKNMSRFRVMYRPKNIFFKLFSKNDSPFMWFRYKNN